jgi:hypothetical protein
MRAGALPLAAITGGPPTEKSYTIRLKPEAAEYGKGLRLFNGTRGEEARPYQLRMAVWTICRVAPDRPTAVEVPDLNRGAAALSECRWRTATYAPLWGRKTWSPAIRSFERGHTFPYGVTVYNATPAAPDSR